MKRTFGIVIGLLTVGAAVYVGSRLWAQPGAGTAPPATAPVAAPPRTPVRIINLSYVVKKYNRWLNFQNEYKGLYKAMYEDKIKDKKDRLDKMTAKVQVTQSPAEREMLQNDIRKLTREMQEISDDAKQTLGQKEMNMIGIIYKEIEDAVREYARMGSIELVMHYNDATEEPDLHAPANIQRKISYGGCVPMYAVQGMDISNAVLDILNRRVLPAAAAPGTPTSGPGATIPGSGGAAVPPAGTIVPTGGLQKPPVRPQ